MTLSPIAVFHSPLTSKFGIPRQSGIVGELGGEIRFLPRYRQPDFVRGLEGFDFIWLLWEFSANRHLASRATVRPPLLGGNEAVGVFATRSPYRPNPIGLSSVRLDYIDLDGSEAPVLHVSGADLMDGTPIFDIKPYVEYSDSHVGGKSGFVDQHEWQCLDVRFAEGMDTVFGQDELDVLTRLLALDPRPQYHNDPMRVYGMPFAGHDVRFRVSGDVLTVIEVE